MNETYDYAECTCGHYYDDHVDTACSFYGCGCGAGLDQEN